MTDTVTEVLGIETGSKQTLSIRIRHLWYSIQRKAKAAYIRFTSNALGLALVWGFSLVVALFAMILFLDLAFALGIVPGFIALIMVYTALFYWIFQHG